MGTTPNTPYCAGLVVADDLTCVNCGRPVAQYPAWVGNGDLRARQMVWQHRRGATVGQAHALRQQLHATERARDDAAARAAAAEARLAEVDALLGDTERLERIERKIDELLSRPAGVVEFRPSHRRHVDGGRPVREQRREAGVRRRPMKPLDGMAG